MKSIAAILSLPAVSLAFQHAAVSSYRNNRMPSRLNFYPENFERAEKCATHYGICDLEEIEKLANGKWYVSVIHEDLNSDIALPIFHFPMHSQSINPLDFCWYHRIQKQPHFTELEQFQSSDLGELQGRDHWKDTKHVEQMLRAQSNFKHMVDDYIGEHHQPETFDMSDVWFLSLYYQNIKLCRGLIGCLAAFGRLGTFWAVDNYYFSLIVNFNIRSRPNIPSRRKETKALTKRSQLHFY